MIVIQISLSDNKLINQPVQCESQGDIDMYTYQENVWCIYSSDEYLP